MLDAIVDRLRPGGLVVFGELHGTHEAPAFVALAAERAAEAGPVVVALELPDDVQPDVDAFWAGGDFTPGPSPFWRWRDGRSGEALVALLARLRALPGASVACCDGAWPSAEARDEGMARAILAVIDARAATLVVCGNLHARSDAPRWMGWHLRTRVPDLVALDLAHDGGCAWVCSDDGCGVKEFGKTRGDGRRGVELFERRDARGFDGVFHVGPLTPSLPVALP